MRQIKRWFCCRIIIFAFATARVWLRISCSIPWPSIYWHLVLKNCYLIFYPSHIYMFPTWWEYILFRRQTVRKCPVITWHVSMLWTKSHAPKLVLVFWTWCTFWVLSLFSLKKCSTTQSVETTHPPCNVLLVILYSAWGKDNRYTGFCSFSPQPVYYKMNKLIKITSRRRLITG